VLDKEGPDFMRHDIFVPTLLKKAPEDERFVMKMMGSVVIPGKYVKKVELDRRLQSAFEAQQAELQSTS